MKPLRQDVCIKEVVSCVESGGLGRNLAYISCMQAAQLDTATDEALAP